MQFRLVVKLRLKKLRNCIDIATAGKQELTETDMLTVGEEASEKKTNNVVAKKQIGRDIESSSHW